MSRPSTSTSLGDPQADDDVDDLEDDEADDAGPDDGGDACRRTGSRPGRRCRRCRPDWPSPPTAATGEDAGQDRADEAADAVDAEGVERVVVAEHAPSATSTAQKQTTPATMPMTSAPVGSTKPEAGVMATRPATAPEMMPSTLGLPRDDPFGEHPGERRGGGGDLGDRHRHAGAAVRGELPSRR